MEIATVILPPLLEMFIIMLFGFILVKLNVLDMKGSQQIAHMLTRFIIPITLALSFQRPFNPDQLTNLLWAFIAALCIILSRILWSTLILGNKSPVDRYATIFSNSVYIGIPIILPTLGYDGILFLSMYVVVSNTFQFTYGIWLLSQGKEEMSLRRILLNPAVLGATTGLILYLAQIQLPTIMYNGLDTIAGLSSPLGMILLGGYLARSQIKQIFLSIPNYWIATNRLVITPLLGIICLWLLPISNPTILLTLAVVNATPTAVNTALFSQIYGGDYKYGARIVVLTSILSLITMPMLLTITNMLVGIY